MDEGSERKRGLSGVAIAGLSIVVGLVSVSTYLRFAVFWPLFTHNDGFIPEGFVWSPLWMLGFIIPTFAFVARAPKSRGLAIFALLLNLVPWVVTVTVHGEPRRLMQSETQTLWSEHKSRFMELAAVNSLRKKDGDVPLTGPDQALAYDRRLSVSHGEDGVQVLFRNYQWGVDNTVNIVYLPGLNRDPAETRGVGAFFGAEPLEKGWYIVEGT